MDYSKETNNPYLTKITGRRRLSSSTLPTVNETSESETNDSLGELSRSSTATTLREVFYSPTSDNKANDLFSKKGTFRSYSDDTIMERFNSCKEIQSKDTEDYFSFRNRAEQRKSLSRPPSWSSIESVDSTKTIRVDDFGNPIEEYSENVASRIQLDSVQRTGGCRDLIGGSSTKYDNLIKCMEKQVDSMTIEQKKGFSEKIKNLEKLAHKKLSHETRVRRSTSDSIYMIANNGKEFPNVAKDLTIGATLSSAASGQEISAWSSEEMGIYDTLKLEITRILEIVELENNSIPSISEITTADDEDAMNDEELAVKEADEDECHFLSESLHSLLNIGNFSDIDGVSEGSCQSDRGLVINRQLKERYDCLVRDRNDIGIYHDEYRKKRIKIKEIKKGMDNEYNKISQYCTNLDNLQEMGDSTDEMSKCCERLSKIDALLERMQQLEKVSLREQLKTGPILSVFAKLLPKNYLERYQTISAAIDDCVTKRGKVWQYFKEHQGVHKQQRSDRQWKYTNKLVKHIQSYNRYFGAYVCLSIECEVMSEKLTQKFIKYTNERISLEKDIRDYNGLNIKTSLKDEDFEKLMEDCNDLLSKENSTNDSKKVMRRPRSFD